jgi:6-phosphogluconolactonase
MIDAEFWDYEDADELAEAVAGDAAFLIEQALEARGRAFVALPGGAAATEALAALAEKKLEWADVTIIPTDERLVAPTDPASNVGKLARLFLPRKARVVPLSAGEKDPRAAGLAADERLAALDWPLDLALLVVGEDGHVASIFPGPDFDAALNGPKVRRALGVTPDPMPADAPYARVSLTKPALVSARVVTLVLKGEKARKTVEKALKDGASSQTPIGRLLADLEMDIDIHWCA